MSQSRNQIEVSVQDSAEGRVLCAGFTKEETSGED
jgi:hypothetical protein